MGYIRWNGKKFYPQKPKPYKPDINELMKPLSEKVGKGNIWGSQIMNVEKEEAVPVSPTPTPSITPTQTITPTPTITPTSTITPTPTPSPIPFDSDAAAYLEDVLVSGGTGITATVSGATDTLFKTLKSDNIYDKLFGFWPMLGGNAGGTAIMAKRVSGSTKDLSYFGGFSYSSSGATGNGVNGWANTKYATNDTLQDDYSIGFYQFTENTPAQTEEIILGQNFPGTAPRLQIGTNTPGLGYFIRSGGLPNANASNSGNIDGFYVLNRTGSTDSQLYRNGNTTPILNVSSTYTEAGSKPIVLWNFYQDTTVYALSYANQGLSFAFIGKGLTSTEMQDLSNAVNTFQTTLNRNTY